MDEDENVSVMVRQRLERIAASHALPGRRRNMMMTPDDAVVILRALAALAPPPQI